MSIDFINAFMGICVYIHRLYRENFLNVRQNDCYVSGPL